MVPEQSGADSPLLHESNWRDVKLGRVARFRCRVRNQPYNFEGKGSVTYRVLIDGVVVARRVVTRPSIVLWSDWEVDLSAFAHRVVEFSIQTEIMFDGPYRPPAGWGDPEILDAQILTDRAQTGVDDDPT